MLVHEEALEPIQPSSEHFFSVIRTSNKTNQQIGFLGLVRAFKRFRCSMDGRTRPKTNDGGVEARLRYLRVVDKK